MSSPWVRHKQYLFDVVEHVAGLHDAGGGQVFDEVVHQHQRDAFGREVVAFLQPPAHALQRVVVVAGVVGVCVFVLRASGRARPCGCRGFRGRC